MNSDYFEKITKKSASLFKAATLCGAIAGGGSPLENDSLAEFGENFGIAFQIRDDLSDIISLKEGATPNLNDLQTLPLIHMNNGKCFGKNLFKVFLQINWKMVQNKRLLQKNSMSSWKILDLSLTAKEK